MHPSKRVYINPDESSMLLALSALTPDQCVSISAAAKIYNVSKTTPKTLMGLASKWDRFQPLR
jgi:hypothetical protein